MIDPPPSIYRSGPLHQAFVEALKDPQLARAGVSICLWWRFAFAGHPAAEPDDRDWRLSAREKADWFRYYADEHYFGARFEDVLPMERFKQIMAEGSEAGGLVPILNALPLDEFGKSLVGLFVRRVFAPYALWHDRSPWMDYAKAVADEQDVAEEALKRLVMIDHLILDAPAIQDRWHEQMRTDPRLRDRISWASVHRLEDKLDRAHRRQSGCVRSNRAERVRQKLRFAAHLQLWAMRCDKRIMPRSITQIFNAMHEEFDAPCDERNDLPVGESLRVKLSQIRAKIGPKKSRGSG